MSRFNPHRPSAEAVYDAARHWRDRCLMKDGSVFTEEALWTSAHVGEQVENFVLRPDEGAGPFIEKLKAQIDPASPAAKRLMAECLWILLLFLSNVTPRAKNALILPVWGWSGTELDATDPLLSDEVLSGLGSGGSGFNNHRWRELRYLIRIAEAAKSVTPSERAPLFEDPWAFNEWLNQIPDEGNRQLKLMLPHLLFPETFERIASVGAVQAILRRFEGIDQSAFRTMSKRKRDEALGSIRAAQESEAGAPIDFYAEPLKAQWAADDVPTVRQDRTPRSVALDDETSPPLNQILYGPPGTGKTYATIERALRIVEPDFYAENANERAVLKRRFDELVQRGAIALVTFHQSLSYEDFVEGLKAEVDADGRLRYSVADKILKRLCTPSGDAGGFEPGNVFSRDYRVLRSTPEILWLRKPNGSKLPFPWEMLNELAALIDTGQATLDDLRSGSLFERVPATGSRSTSSTATRTSCRKLSKSFSPTGPAARVRPPRRAF